MKKRIVSIVAAVLITGSSLHAFPGPGKAQLTTAITAGLVTSYGLLYYNKYKSYCKAVQEAEDYIESSQGQDAFNLINDHAVVQDERSMQKWGMVRWPTAIDIRNNYHDVMVQLRNDCGAHLNLCKCYVPNSFGRFEKAIEVEQKRINHLIEQLSPYTLFKSESIDGEIRVARVGLLDQEGFNNLDARVIDELRQSETINFSELNFFQRARHYVLKFLNRDMPQQSRIIAGQLSWRLYLLHQRFEELKYLATFYERNNEPLPPPFETTHPGINVCNSPYCCNQ